MLINGGLEITSDQLAADPSLMSADNLVHISATVNSNALTGWTIGGASIDVVPNYYWANTEGTYSVDLVGTSGVGSISQTVTGLISGKNYELSFDFSVNPSEGHGGEADFTKWLEVDISNSNMPASYFSGTVGTRTVSNMQYVRRAVDFTASSESTTISLVALFPSGLPASFSNGTPILPYTLCAGPAIDNVTLEPVSTFGIARAPEPASLGVLGMGGVFLLRRRSSR
jgi:hypothetical protein